MTIDAQVPRAVPAELVALGRPVHVVHDEQIQPAVVVVVEPARGDRPGVVRHARSGSDVLEPAVAHVAEQMVALHARDKQVDTAIIVEIAGGRPGRVALRLDPRPLGHIGERQAAVVVKEAIPVPGVLLAQGRDGCAVGEVDVRQAVAVVIEHGDAARHRLHHVLLGCRVLVEREGQPGLGRDILEADGTGLRRLCVAVRRGHDENQHAEAGGSSDPSPPAAHLRRSISPLCHSVHSAQSRVESSDCHAQQERTMAAAGRATLSPPCIVHCALRICLHTPVQSRPCQHPPGASVQSPVPLLPPPYPS